MPAQNKDGPEQYRERAAAARAAAEAEALEHVRQKLLDAATAWERMALPPRERLSD